VTWFNKLTIHFDIVRPVNHNISLQK